MENISPDFSIFFPNIPIFMHFCGVPFLKHFEILKKLSIVSYNSHFLVYTAQLAVGLAKEGED